MHHVWWNLTDSGEKRYEATIPPGAEPGKRIRLRGKGEGQGCAEKNQPAKS